MQMDFATLLAASLRKRSSNYYAYGTEDFWREENRVGIDLSSRLQSLTKPFCRREEAQLLRRHSRLGANSIALTFIFSPPSTPLDLAKARPLGVYNFKLVAPIA